MSEEEKYMRYKTGEKVQLEDRVSISRGYPIFRVAGTDILNNIIEVINEEDLKHCKPPNVIRISPNGLELVGYDCKEHKEGCCQGIVRCDVCGRVAFHLIGSGHCVYCEGADFLDFPMTSGELETLYHCLISVEPPKVFKSLPEEDIYRIAGHHDKLIVTARRLLRERKMLPEE